MIDETPLEFLLSPSPDRFVFQESNSSLNCHRLLGNRTISMEKQEIIQDEPADSRGQESDLETTIMLQNEQEWPKDWRAYAACFAGFCGMALCW